MSPAPPPPPDAPVYLPAGEELAGLDATTRRLGWFALLHGVVVAGWMLVAGGTARDLIVLTAGVAASIFLIRSLRAQVAHLDPRASRAAGRAILGALGRYAALAFLLLALLQFGRRHALAAALGAASLPCALLVETLVQVLGSRRRFPRER